MWLTHYLRFVIFHHSVSHLWQFTQIHFVPAKRAIPNPGTRAEFGYASCLAEPGHMVRAKNNTHHEIRHEMCTGTKILSSSLYFWFILEARNVINVSCLKKKAERKLVQMVRSKPGTIKGQVCHEVEAAGAQCTIMEEDPALKSTPLSWNKVYSWLELSPHSEKVPGGVPWLCLRPQDRFQLLKSIFKRDVFPIEMKVLSCLAWLSMLV